MAISRTRLLMMGIGDPAVCHALTRRTIVVGDPGIGGFFKRIAGAAGNIGASFVPGGAIGRDLIRRSLGAGAPARPPALFQAPRPSLLQRGLNLLPNITPQQARSGGIALAGTAIGALGGGVLGRFLGGAAGPAPTGGRMIAGGRRRRHMRATNVKALRRATRRLSSFHRLAVSTESALSHLVRRRSRRVSHRRRSS
jgi:hypothetical protein